MPYEKRLLLLLLLTPLTIVHIEIVNSIVKINTNYNMCSTCELSTLSSMLFLIVCLSLLEIPSHRREWNWFCLQVLVITRSDKKYLFLHSVEKFTVSYIKFIISIVKTFKHKLLYFKINYSKINFTKLNSFRITFLKQ